MKTVITSIAAALVLAGTAAGEESISIEPGQWSFDNTMSGSLNMGGGQTMAMPSRTTSSSECVTPEDATITPERMIEEMEEDGGNECAYGDIDFSGRTMSTTITCTSDGIEMVGDYTFTVSEDRRAGTGSMEMTGTMNGMTMESSFVMEGELTGPCG
ncbi:MAG: DUF3617 family protein [Pseudomonadota bacterium]